jgi:hypothetical protein
MDFKAGNKNPGPLSRVGSLCCPALRKFLELEHAVFDREAPALISAVGDGVGLAGRCVEGQRNGLGAVDLDEELIRGGVELRRIRAARGTSTSGRPCFPGYSARRRSRAPDDRLAPKDVAKLAGRDIDIIKVPAAD